MTQERILNTTAVAKATVHLLPTPLIVGGVLRECADLQCVRSDDLREVIRKGRYLLADLVDSRGLIIVALGEVRKGVVPGAVVRRSKLRSWRKYLPVPGGCGISKRAL